MCMFHGLFGEDSEGNSTEIRIIFSWWSGPHAGRVPLLPDIGAYLLMRSDGSGR